MRVWNTVSEWLEHRSALAGRTIGLVPTMGALHRGHMSLVERSRRENDIVVVTIFVNPTQFNDPADLDRYPRTLDSDLELLRAAGADHVLLPSTAELYPEGYRLRIDGEHLSSVMEGRHRPGFLQGVLTVVLKLFNIVRADRAYFGEKDFQQLRTIQEMTREFFVPTAIVPCDTVREPSGLAESSRNALLSAEARRHAAHIHRSLTTAASAEAARSLLESQGFAAEYVEEHWGRRFGAVFLEGVRLIDNVPLPGR
jgi:pantoate--beta-alanine ligase